jgi:cytochrome c oxidase subunit 2
MGSGLSDAELLRRQKLVFAGGSHAGRGAVVRRALGLGVSSVGVAALLSGCSIGKTFAGFGWPAGVSPEAHRMYDIWIASVVAALVVGVLVWGLIFWCVFRYRKSSEELPPQTRYNLPMELLYTVLPFLIVAVLFYYTATTQTFINRESPNPDVRVEVVAFKWNWEFRYLNNGATGQDGQPISTIGTSDYVPVLVVPTGKRIRFTEHSQDVVHSFWVPDLLFKRDVFPGNVINSFEVTVDQEGAYVGRCAELCGAFHSMMNFEVRAVSPDKFQAYLAARKSGMTTPEALTSIGEQGTAKTTSPFDTRAGLNAGVRDQAGG